MNTDNHTPNPNPNRRKFLSTLPIATLAIPASLAGVGGGSLGASGIMETKPKLQSGMSTPPTPQDRPDIPEFSFAWKMQSGRPMRALHQPSELLAAMQAIDLRLLEDRGAIVHFVSAEKPVNYVPFGSISVQFGPNGISSNVAVDFRLCIPPELLESVREIVANTPSDDHPIYIIQRYLGRYKNAPMPKIPAGAYVRENRNPENGIMYDMPFGSSEGRGVYLPGVDKTDFGGRCQYGFHVPDWVKWVLVNCELQGRGSYNPDAQKEYLIPA